MKFCSKCKGLMKPIENEKSKLICISCKNIEDGEITSVTKIKKKPEKGEGFVEDKDIFADHDFICKKCGHNKAQIIIKGPQISDEDDPIYLRCGKCGKAQQLARKIS